MNIVFLLPIILRAVKSGKLTRVNINLLLPQVESIMAERRKRSLASSKHSSGHEQEDSTVCWCSFSVTEICMCLLLSTYYLVLLA